GRPLRAEWPPRSCLVWLGRWKPPVMLLILPFVFASYLTPWMNLPGGFPRSHPPSKARPGVRECDQQGRKVDPIDVTPAQSLDEQLDLPACLLASTATRLRAGPVRNHQGKGAPAMLQRSNSDETYCPAPCL